MDSGEKGKYYIEDVASSHKLETIHKRMKGNPFGKISYLVIYNRIILFNYDINVFSKDM